MIHVKQNYRQADLTDLKLVQFQTSIERSDSTHWNIFSFRNRKRKKQILVLKYLKRHTFVFQIKFDNAQ